MNERIDDSSQPSCWLPDDVARCAGVGSDAGGWREGCDLCLRRIATGGRVHMEPPPIIAFWCEYQIEANAEAETSERSE